MAFADLRRSESVMHRHLFRVVSIEGSTVKVLWEGGSMAEGQAEAERLAVAARARGSQETVALDAFRIEVEKAWVQRLFVSRAPSAATTVRHLAGKRGRPRILYMPLEFQTWNMGGHSWSYAANLAYVDGLRAAGCDVTVVNTACTFNHRKLIGDRRFDQVWFHGSPRHMDDFAFRQWVADIAPVRLMLSGETIHYPEADDLGSPWLADHAATSRRWEPFITHAAFVDPADVPLSKVRATWWQQAVPERFVLPVNRNPSKDAAVFVGTLYPPRDRWAWDLAGLLERVECPESDLFCWLFENSHEWIQRALDPEGPGPWWTRKAHAAYNRLQLGLRRRAFRNFLGAIRDGVAIVSLPSMVKTYSGRVFEGMAAGRPVITQRIVGQPEIFEDGTEILHYNDVDQLRDHIEMLQAQPRVATMIAEDARRAILARHTVEKRTAELLRFAEGA